MALPGPSGISANAAVALNQMNPWDSDFVSKPGTHTLHEIRRLMI